ncbi:hypothetical protein EV192_104280 [Actinocrispum wychmicini]|uniref:NB-ARC domain-containing protein n=1 Tax=Actinocrispum wychmicini TaxID=1213861 RepID=A0A4R2JQH9_9PSEU|nr:hypothetical protein EV192_104280 [Actinocrispum wychmicini]
MAGDVGTVVQMGIVEGGMRVHQSVHRPVVALPHRAGIFPVRAAAFQHRAVADLLARVLACDSVVHTVVVSGLGGVGKTQLVLDCAERLWALGQVELLVWVTAGSREAVVSSFARLGADLTGIEDPDAESCTQARWADRWRSAASLLPEADGLADGHRATVATTIAVGDSASQRRIAFATTIGTTIEWYDNFTRTALTSRYGVCDLARPSSGRPRFVGHASRSAWPEHLV